MIPMMLGVALYIPAGRAPAAEKAPGAPMNCIDRPKDVQQPPKRLAPVHRARGGKGGSDEKRPVRVAPLGFKPLCAPGKVPALEFAPNALPIKVQKGNPLLAADSTQDYLKLQGAQQGEFIRRHVRSFEEVYPQADEKPDGTRNPPPGPPPGPPPACDGVLNFGSCYYYGSAAFQTAADGGGMTESIQKPTYVNTGGAGHTLNELAVQGGDRDGNIIELGWLISTEQYGNANPHLFVFHWKNWTATCYDACGWVQWSNTYHPGMDLGEAVGRNVYIGYVFYQGNWWAWFDNQWLGYFPGSEWDGQYTKTALIQWFGEVASENGIPPKSGMGDDRLPTSLAAAGMSTLCDVDAKAWTCWYRDQQSLTRTVPSYYDISRASFGATRYGGPGQ
jgi:hypothetical protein